MARKQSYIDALLRPCGGPFIDAGYQEVILPSIYEASTFIGKMGEEKEEKMWTFDTRGDTPARVALVPEITGMIQELWNNGWSKSMKKPTRLFYLSRCYRYDRPQKGRYREFTQFGIELLGNKNPEQEKQEVIDLLDRCLKDLEIPYTLEREIKRGIGYYTEDGFEAESETLGAQRQIAGGGRYAEGIGWAIGVDRIMLLK